MKVGFLHRRYSTVNAKARNNKKLAAESNLFLVKKKKGRKGIEGKRRGM